MKPHQSIVNLLRSLELVRDGCERITPTMPGQPPWQQLAASYCLILRPDLDRYMVHHTPMSRYVIALNTQDYHELRAAAVETLILIPFPSDKELAFLCGALGSVIVEDGSDEVSNVRPKGRGRKQGQD